MSYEEDTSTLINNLVPETTPKEKINKDKTEEVKRREDRGGTGYNTDEDIGEDTDDSDSGYFY